MTIAPKIRFTVLSRDGFKCVYCGAPGGEKGLELDHRIPKSKGGPDTEDNLVTSCYSCNRGKGAREATPPDKTQQAAARHGTMVGMWFISRDEDNKIHRQGRITRELVSGALIVQLASWIDGRLNVSEVIPSEAVSRLTLFNDDEKLRDYMDRQPDRWWAL